MTVLGLIAKPFVPAKLVTLKRMGELVGTTAPIAEGRKFFSK